MSLPLTTTTVKILDLLKLLNEHRKVDRDIKLDRVSWLAVEIDASVSSMQDVKNGTLDMSNAFMDAGLNLSIKMLNHLIKETLSVTKNVAYSDCTLMLFHMPVSKTLHVVSKILLKNKENTTEGVHVQFGHELGEKGPYEEDKRKAILELSMSTEE